MKNFVCKDGNVYCLEDDADESILPVGCKQISDKEMRKLTSPSTLQKANEARAKRDEILVSSDFYLLIDYPISEENLALVKSYRQALRDVPAQDGFPDSVIWPVLELV